MRTRLAVVLLPFVALACVPQGSGGATPDDPPTEVRRPEPSYGSSHLRGEPEPIPEVRAPAAAADFLSPMERDLAVWKIGRTTGITIGRVRAFALDDLEVDYGAFCCTFSDQLEIVGNDGPFSLGGDSGSLVLDGGNRAVGLLFAGSETGVTFANPIAPVLRALDVKLVM